MPSPFPSPSVPPPGRPRAAPPARARWPSTSTPVSSPTRTRRCCGCPPGPATASSTTSAPTPTCSATANTCRTGAALPATPTARSSRSRGSPNSPAPHGPTSPLSGEPSGPCRRFRPSGERTGRCLTRARSTLAAPSTRRCPIPNPSTTCPGPRRSPSWPPLGPARARHHPGLRLLLHRPRARRARPHPRRVPQPPRRPARTRRDCPRRPRARGRRGSLRPRDHLPLPGLPTRLGPPRPRGLTSHYQTRWWARIELDSWQPNHETSARQLVAPGDVLTTLSWHRKQIAGRLLDLALAAEHAYRGGDE